MVDCGHDMRDTDCEVCIADRIREIRAILRAPVWAIPQCRSVDVLADPTFDAFHGLDVPFTDGSNH